MGQGMAGAWVVLRRAAGWVAGARDAVVRERHTTGGLEGRERRKESIQGSWPAKCCGSLMAGWAEVEGVRQEGSIELCL